MHFRLCPCASSHCGQVLSLHIGERPHAHPRLAVPSACAWQVVQRHTRKCEACSRPVPALPRGNLLMNVAAPAALRRDGRMPQQGEREKTNKKARFHSGDRASAREMGGVCLHVSLTRVFALIAITKRTRLGRARKRHLARNADLIRCLMP